MQANLNKRKWAVEFYFSPTDDAQVLFRSESMPRKNAERVMDELMDALIISNSRVYNSVMAKLGR